MSNKGGVVKSKLLIKLVLSALQVNDLQRWYPLQVNDLQRKCRLQVNDLQRWCRLKVNDTQR